MALQFTTPTARYLFGSPFVPQKVTDPATKKPKLDASGAETFEYVIGVGIAKNDPAFPAFYASLKTEDKAAWPQFHDPAGSVLPGVTFADKFTDGDGFDKKGQSYAKRDGYAGNWVFTLKSQFAPQIWLYVNGKWVQTEDPKAIRPGYYVQVQGTTSSNQSTQSPGMYRNLQSVAFQAYGPEIVSQGVNPDEAFTAPGAAPLPPGASLTPVAIAGAPTPPLAPVVTAAPPVAPVAPVPATQVAPTPSPSSAPYDGYMQPPAAPAAPVPPAPTSPVMTAKAGGTPYEAFLAQGWTDATLRAEGYIQ